MNTGTLTIVIVIAVIIIAAIGVAIFRQTQKQRSERLREQFGPEYDRAVEQKDDRRSAESELRAREKRQRELELRTLDQGQRRHFEQRWSDVQRDFVDGPGQAVRQADILVVDVMTARGYPVDDFDQRADDLSVRYPVVTARYREARQISRANERGEASTEDLRGAVTSYRSLVEALLQDDDRTEQRRGNEPAGGAGGRIADRRDSDDRDADSRRGDRGNFADREAGDRRTAERQTVDRDTADRRTGDRDTADREAGDRESADPDSADRETAGRGLNGQGRTTPQRNGQEAGA
jgi:hypothetical protein